ncbi:hypothetical protein ACT3OH_19410 [Vreelandella zhanjiangensis]|uniref:hypothetical protein n=1 Tax=Vreelandella zhanjiangensis TaxID=1121960 RepID=UPI00402A7F41
MLTKRQLQQLKNEETPLHVQIRRIHLALGASQRHKHHGAWLSKGQRYFYQEERALATWIEIEGDIIRSCLTDSSDGGAWGFDSNGHFYVTCFYYETTERPDSIAKVKQLYLKSMQSKPPCRNAYLEAKGR